jgi:copper chaperone
MIDGKGARRSPLMFELTLPSMTCGHCVKTVTETVRKIDAQAQLMIDLPSHKVQIESLHASQEFKDALAEEGYAAA